MKFEFMKTISVVLPKADNDGASLNWEPTLKQVAMVFGGYTLTDISGGWVSDNKLYKDESYKLEMSFVNLDGEMINTYFNVLHELFETQLAVLTTLPSGTLILEPSDMVEYSKQFIELYNA